MLKVCHITSAHKWDDIRIFRKQCVSLAKAGFETYLLSFDSPSEKINMVNIVNAGTKPVNRISRITKSTKILLFYAKKINADIYHLHDPELLPLGLKLIKNGKKVIYDAHEDLPQQILGKYWIPTLLRKLISNIAKLYLKYAISKLSASVGATPIITEKLVKFNANSINVNNFPLLEELSYLNSNSEKKQIFCYIGGLFKSRGLMEMLTAIENVDAELYLAGNFSPESLELEVRNHAAWHKVKYLGFLERKNVYQLMNSSVAGLVILHPLQSYIDSLPIKMFEYMSSGIPVICSDFEIWKSIVEQERCGICVNPLNVKEISDAMNFLLNNTEKSKLMGINGKKAVLEKYNWQVEEKKLLELYYKFSKKGL